MAAHPSNAQPEPGAPVPRDAIDPELVKLSRTRPKIGIVTAACVVALCVYFVFRLGPDRAFGGEDEIPTPVALADVVDGKIPDDSYVAIAADPMMSHGVRASQGGGDLGYRVVPARGANERLWLVLSGDGWDKPNLKSYHGRLRRIGDVPFGRVLDQHTTANPRPVFATAAAVRAGFGVRRVATVTGDHVAPADGDKVAIDLIDPSRSTIVASFVDPRAATPEDPGHGPLLDAAAWIAELAKHGITAVPAPPGQADDVLRQVRLDVQLPADAVTEKLLAAQLLAASVNKVARHHETTWGALRTSPTGGFVIDGQTLPDAHVELIGLYVRRGVPADAYVLLGAEKPADYWHVRPITFVLAIIGLLFGWALVRNVRDLLPTRS